MDPISVTLCRRISFSSGLQTARPELSEEANRRLFGSAYSPHGHGYNFVLEAHIEGALNFATGMVVNLREVDDWLKEVTGPLDHHFLNTDIPFFQTTVPTAENVALYCFRELQKRTRAGAIRLVRIRLYQSEDLWVDCAPRSGAGE